MNIHFAGDFTIWTPSSHELSVKNNDKKFAADYLADVQYILGNDDDLSANGYPPDAAHIRETLRIEPHNNGAKFSFELLPRPINAQGEPIEVDATDKDEAKMDIAYAREIKATGAKITFYQGPADVQEIGLDTLA